jgi:hypothetical protein
VLEIAYSMRVCIINCGIVNDLSSSRLKRGIINRIHSYSN